MPRLTSKTGFTAAVLGTMLLLELAAVRLLFTADPDFVYFLGRRINIVCSAQRRLGIPCPTCGLTRGSALTLHGRIRDAWRLSPSGPLAVMGIFGMGMTCLVFAAFEPRRTPLQVAWMRRWVQAGALAYAGASTLIWVGTWLSVVTKLRGHP